MAPNPRFRRLFRGSRPCVFAPDPVSLHRLPVSHRFPELTHAIVAVFSAHPERESERGGDRLASADAARRHDAAGGGRHLCLAAAGLAGAEEDRADRARGTEPRRRAGTADADAAAGRPLARKRPLRRLRSGDAAHHRPPQARIAVRADQRGNDHRDLPRLRANPTGACRSISTTSSGSSATSSVRASA